MVTGLYIWAHVNGVICPLPSNLRGNTQKHLYPWRPHLLIHFNSDLAYCAAVFLRLFISYVLYLYKRTISVVSVDFFSADYPFFFFTKLCCDKKVCESFHQSTHMESLLNLCCIQSMCVTATPIHDCGCSSAVLFPLFSVVELPAAYTSEQPFESIWNHLKPETSPVKFGYCLGRGTL